MSHAQLDDGHAVAASKQPEWVQEFNAALARRDYKAPVTPGPHCCASACCVGRRPPPRRRPPSPFLRTARSL